MKSSVSGNIQPNCYMSSCTRINIDAHEDLGRPVHHQSLMVNALSTNLKRWCLHAATQTMSW